MNRDLPVVVSGFASRAPRVPAPLGAPIGQNDFVGPLTLHEFDLDKMRLAVDLDSEPTSVNLGQQRAADFPLSMLIGRSTQHEVADQTPFFVEHDRHL